LTSPQLQKGQVPLICVKALKPFEIRFRGQRETDTIARSISAGETRESRPFRYRFLETESRWSRGPSIAKDYTIAFSFHVNVHISLDLK